MANLKRGSRGRDVVALQNALNSKTRPSPRLVADGIFGSKTDAAVRAYQVQEGLAMDGIAGPVTKRSLGLKSTRPTFTHKVRVHFRALATTDQPFERLLATAQSVYSQYGIKFEYASGESMGLTPAETAKFQQIDGTCSWSITGGEYAELQSMGGSVPSNEVIVFFAPRFASATLRGCGGHMPNRPACIVAAHGTRYTMAHEVGHVLLTSSFRPVHHSSTDNLMFSDTGGISSRVPTLSDAQVTQIKKSPCCVRI